jgi:hypothetical protein
MLDKIIYPTQNQKEKELWDVSGIIKGKSNQEFKFDLRPLKKINTGENVKEGSFLTKADKMVFETSLEWIIVDTEELHNYIKQHKLKIVKLEELVKNIDWNIILPKK